MKRIVFLTILLLAITTSSFGAVYATEAESVTTTPVTETAPSVTEPPEDLPPESGSLGASLTFRFDAESGTLTVSGNGMIPDYTSSSAPFLAYADVIRSLVLEEGITAIGANAFLGLSLQSVTVPDAVTHIGSYALGFYLNNGGYEKVSGFTIKADSSSAAAQYASQNGFSFISTSPDPTGTCGNGVSWTLNASGVLTIAGNGGMADYLDGSAPYAKYATGADGYRITSVVIEEGVTRIGAGAFEDFTHLASVALPSSLADIGESAFEGCSSLTSLTIPGSVRTIGNRAFSGCYALSSLSLSSGLTTIGERAFELTAITTLHLPNTVSSLGSYAFYGCGSLTDVSTGSLTEIPAKAFAVCDSLRTLSLGGSLAVIGESAFEDCISLDAITLPSSLHTIAERAFYGCFSLTSVQLPASLTSLGSYAFYDCSAVASLVIGDGLSEIPTAAFAGCEALSSVTIGSSLTQIGDYAFADCNTLRSILIPHTVKFIGTSALGYVKNGSAYLVNPTFRLEIQGQTPSAAELYAQNNSLIFTSFGTVATDGGDVTDEISWSLTTATGVLMLSGKGEMPDYAAFSDTPWRHYQEYIKTVVIGNGITKLSACAFDTCYQLTTITLPSSLQTIGSAAFAGTGIVSLSLPTGITTIEDGAFEACAELTTVALPDTLVHIGPYAFRAPNKLTSVLVPDSVEYVGNYAIGFQSNNSRVDGFIIRGTKGSAAESYAQHEGISFRENGHSALTDPSSGATITFPGESIDGISFTVSQLTSGLDGTVLLAPQEYALVYEVSLHKDNAPVQLEGMATLTLPIPANLNPLTVSIYAMDENGVFTKLTPDSGIDTFIIKTNALHRIVFTNADLDSLYTITIHHAYADRSEAAADVIVRATTGASYEFEAISLDGYAADAPTYRGTVTEGDLELTFTYNEASITTLPATTQPSSKGGSGKGFGTILLTVIIILVVALIAAVLLLLYLNKKKKNQHSETAKTIAAAAKKKAKSDKFAATIIVPEFKTQDIDIESLFADEPEEDKEAEEALKNKAETEKATDTQA